MITSRHTRSESALLSLETAAASARSGFACMFSTSDEYETALIQERLAEGRYGTTGRRWPMVAFVGGCMMVVGTVLLFA
jgi:hypothetical protein